MPELPPVDPEDDRKTYDDWSDVMKGKVEPEADKAIKNNPMGGKLPRKSFWDTTNKTILIMGCLFTAVFTVCSYFGYC